MYNLSFTVYNNITAAIKLQTNFKETIVNFNKRIQINDKQWQKSHRDIVRFERNEMNFNDSSPGLGKMRT